jgi:hypothetical protein
MITPPAVRMPVTMTIMGATSPGFMPGTRSK